jgi:RNA polymerase sigma-70 factor (ECF subfamily)
MLLTDEMLMMETCNGSLPAFELLVQRWDKRMLNYLYRCVGDRAEAEDLRQELFLKLYNNRKSFDGKRNFQPWLYRIAANLVIDKIARKKKPVMEAIHEQNGDSVPVLQETQEKHSRGRAMMNEIADRIKTALETIPGEERIVLIMRHYENLTFKEIAQVLDTPESTVKTRLYHGLRLLRDQLKRMGIVGMECMQPN